MPPELQTAPEQQSSNQSAAATAKEPEIESESEHEDLKMPPPVKVPPVPRRKEDLEIPTGEVANDDVYTTSFSEDSEWVKLKNILLNSNVLTTYGPKIVNYLVLDRDMSYFEMWVVSRLM